ncbi:MAG: Fic family protein [Deltaproteobacteria bacterium]|nr:Fic family protein [Deltaproteobacteria bacterium]
MDPYLIDGTDVLRNKLGLNDQAKLDQAEADILFFRFFSVDNAVAKLPFGFLRLLAIHKHILGDIYDWAGSVRTISIVKGELILGGDTVRYSQDNCIKPEAEKIISDMNRVKWSELNIHETAERFSKLTATLWQVHPFREGNNRTTIGFATQFAEAHGFPMNKAILKDNEYLRQALVKASDGQYSVHDYLVKIFEEAIRRW